MTGAETVQWVALGAIAAKLGAQLLLERVNVSHAAALHGGREDRKMVDYLRARSAVDQADLAWRAVFLAALLFSGFLPWLWRVLGLGTASNVFHQGAFVLAVVFLMGLARLPADWVEQFRVEERFGFNRSNQKLWWADQFRGWLLLALLGWPLVAVLLWFVGWSPKFWWLWGWATFLGFQLLMMIVAPVLILPLFNKLTPLQDGQLKTRLLALADKCGFQTRGIQVMDGSRRSGHSNAFFTGVGKFRRIVLFDTLIEQMDPRQTEAVLAHEIGHWKLGHIPRLLLVGAATSLLGFWLLWQLIQQPVLFEAFGFGGGSVAAALALVVALSGTFTFWAGPLGNLLSRRHEYQADAYAKRVLGDGLPLAEALRLLTEKNLSNPSPHPAYSVFYHSHPTASERERALLG